MNEDVDVTIDNLAEKRKITPTLAAILTAKNIDSLWGVFGNDGVVNKNAEKCPIL
jgi:hypothetical protein